jgi:hypothetical protein
VSKLNNSWVSVDVICFCANLVAEDGDSSGTQSLGNVRRWKPLPSKGSEDVTVDNSVCVTVNCKVWSRAVSNSLINPVINLNPV